MIASTPSFRDGVQRAKTCRKLLDLVDAAERWTATGPAPEASAAFERTAAEPDAQRILAACWAIWEGSSTLGVNELLLLEPRRLEAVGELLAAIARGATAIDAWLARWECPASARPAVVVEHPSLLAGRRRGA